MEKMGVDEIKQFRTHSEPILRQMLLMIAEVIREEIVEKINKSQGFGLLTDEVTDIPNTAQLITFAKYYNKEKGDAETCFIGLSDLLAESEDTSANAQSIFNSLVALVKDRLQLKLQDLKAFGSDGAAVMTGRKEGVAARLKSLPSCKTMLNIHCICYRLALACSDTGDELSCVKDFEHTMMQLWKFFKNSSKILKVYIKVALKCNTLDIISKRKKRKFVKRVKRAVTTRWLSLHASVDSVFTEYVGLVNTLRVLKDDPASGPMAAGLLKKLDSIRFLGVLYMFKTVLPHLSALSKTFQTGAINFSRIIPGISKLKSNISEIERNDSVMSELKKDLANRLQDCGLVMSSMEEDQIRKNIFGRYTAALISNVESRFPTSSVDVLDGFSIFNVEQLPPGPASTLFQFYGDKEVSILKKHFFQSSLEDQNELLSQWKSFKFDLIELRKKWLNFKEQVALSKLKLKQTATKWTLRQVLCQFREEFGHIMTIAKTALVAPVLNAWPERGGSAMKRIKTRSRNQMKNDMLHGSSH